MDKNYVAPIEIVRYIYITILSAALFLIEKDIIIMFCHIKQQDDVHPQKRDYHYRIGTYIIRTKLGNRIKKTINMRSKQNSEIISGSAQIQNYLIYFSLPSNDIFHFQLAHGVSSNMLGVQTYGFPNIQGFLKYEYSI